MWLQSASCNGEAERRRWQLQSFCGVDALIGDQAADHGAAILA